MVENIGMDSYTDTTKGETHEPKRNSRFLSTTFPVVGLEESYQKKFPRKTVNSCREAAGMLSSLSGSAQEECYLLTAHRSGRVLTLHRYSKGSNQETTAIVNQMSGHLFELPDPHTVYLVHNHPNGDLLPSQADLWVLKTLKDTLRIQNIDTKGVLIANKQFVEFDENTVWAPGMVPASKEEFWMPVSERKIIERKPLNQKRLFPGQSILDRFKRSPDGILFADTHTRELGFVPFEKGKTRDVAAKILAKADQLNAVNAFINMQTNTNTNRGNLYSALARGLEGQGIVARDVVGKTSEGDLISFVTDNNNKLLPPDSEAIQQLDSDEVLYATSSDFEQGRARYCFDSAPGQGISLKDIQERFKGQTIFKGDDGSLSIHFENGQGAKISFIDHISDEEIQMLIASGRMDKDGVFLGKCSQNQIMLSRDLSSNWIRDHEFCHLLKNLKIITDKDFNALDKQIQSWKESNALRFQPQNPKDDRAHALAQILEDRKEQRSTPLGSMSQKVEDFIDGLWHIGRSSSKKLAREIESGKIFKRPVKKDIVQEDIDQHLTACTQAEDEMQELYEQLMEKSQIKDEDGHDFPPYHDGRLSDPDNQHSCDYFFIEDTEPHTKLDTSESMTP